jgi:crotonobetainyl-CoA:carnitine CoA-transferase CaiB-like acyl-CoA transferase
MNIESQAGQSIVRRLVQDTDILVESFPPGYLDGFGLGYSQLAG